MLYLDFVFLIFCILSCFYCSFVIFRIAFRTPIPMFYILLAVSVLSLGFNFFLITFIYINEFSLLLPFFNFILTQNFGNLILRIGQFFAIFFVFSFTMTTFAPLIKINIESLAIVICATLCSTASYCIDASTLTYTVTNGQIHIVSNIVGAGFLVLSLLTLVFVLLIRYWETQDSFSKKNLNPNLIGRRNIYILIFLFIISFLFGRQFDILPSNLWAGLLAVGLIYLTYSFKKDNAFYFISNTKLEAVIILNTLSGKVQFYRNFQQVDILITGVMTAFNISIKQLISSQTDIRQVFFEDKALLMKKGEFTTTIVFVSEKSIISDSITLYLSKKFEEKYQSVLKENPYGANDLKIFQPFDEIIKQITSYFTL